MSHSKAIEKAKLNATIDKAIKINVETCRFNQKPKTKHAFN